MTAAQSRSSVCSCSLQNVGSRIHCSTRYPSIRSACSLTNEKEKVAVSAFQTMPSTELTRSMNRRCAATLLCPHSDTDTIEHVLGLARGGRDLKTSRAFAKQQYSATLGCRVTREETV